MQPIATNIRALNRLVRLVKGSPRCLVVFDRKAELQVVDVFSDNGWSSSYVMLGGNLFASSATTRNVVETSSGEAEFYALTKSASRALGAVAMAVDMVTVGQPHDAEEALARLELTIPRVQGCENPVDLGTKQVAQKEMRKCMRAAPEIVSGRSKLALRVAKG